ncbi:ABC transporter permease, partial [Escherichia coli]|nr:ABC transporter permease [Escherichia coli]
NGILVAYFDLQPIVATLILMVAGRGIAQLITEGSIVTFTEPGLIFFGTGSFAGIPMPILIAVSLLVVAIAVVRRTAIGLLIESIGINRSASSYAGLNSKLLLLVIYGFC